MAASIPGRLEGIQCQVDYRTSSQSSNSARWFTGLPLRATIEPGSLEGFQSWKQKCQVDNRTSNRAVAGLPVRAATEPGS